MENYCLKNSSNQFCKTRESLRKTLFEKFVFGKHEDVDRQLNWKNGLEYLYIFSPNAGKKGPEKLRIQTLFTQWWS